MEALQRLHNRGSISTGYDIDNSCKFEEDNSEYLERATGGGNGSTTKHTISVWVKRTEITKTSFILGFANIGRLRFESDDKIEYQFRSGRKIETNRLFRDTSAWYHIVVVADSSLATSTDRMKLYVNGVRETDLLTYVAQDQNQGSPAWGVYNTYNYRIGYSGSSGDNFNGYIADAYYINGQTLDPTDFGETDEDSGIWKPKAFTGTFDSLDNYLDFSNSSNLGEDANGGTDLSSNNITSADQSTDTPTNNFCTWNPLWNYASYPTISEGATKVRIDDSTDEGAKASIGLTNGKWYWEAKPVGTIGSQYIGIQTDGDSNIYSNANSLLNNYTMVINTTGRYYSYSGSLSESSAGQFTNFTTSQWLGIALDMDSGTQTIKYYKDGSLILTLDLISTMQGQTVFPFLVNYENRSWDINFGGYTINTISSAASDADGYGTFEYAPPSGYYALCTKNLEEYG